MQKNGTGSVSRASDDQGGEGGVESRFSSRETETKRRRYTIRLAVRTSDALAQKAPAHGRPPARPSMMTTAG